MKIPASINFEVCQRASKIKIAKKKKYPASGRGNISSLPASDHVYYLLASQRTFEVNFPKMTALGGGGVRNISFLGGGVANLI